MGRLPGWAVRPEGLLRPMDGWAARRATHGWMGCLPALRPEGPADRQERKEKCGKRKERRKSVAPPRECRRLETYGFSPDNKLHHHHLLNDRSALRASLAKYPTKEHTPPVWCGVYFSWFSARPVGPSIISPCEAWAYSTPFFLWAVSE